jgi:hypothetical protein
MHTPRRAVIAAVIGAGALLVTAIPAGAHVAPDPSSVKPGKTVTVGFTPEHGCDGSPIISMRFRVPRGVKDATAEPKDGWQTTATGRTITFSGSSMPSTETSAFAISFTAPNTKRVLSWKVIETCEVGVERWIQRPDGNFPAPLVGVGKKVANAE